ncbi:MAG: ATP-binding protein, partial [Anaerolineales bacterium]|nr:ATP-binding protein [Anaerolineales bacterium]
DLAAARNLAPEEALETVDVRPQLEKILARFQAEAESGRVELLAELGSATGVVHASPDGLEKILANLVGNAIKYTPAGGQVRVSLHQAGEQLCITVHDTGIGIPPAALEQLGEEFFRAPNAKQSGVPGTGLGLSIVKRLVERFGGRLEVESWVGSGSNFRVYLPATQASEKSADAP